jgi:hypothetical protein
VVSGTVDGCAGTVVETEELGAAPLGTVGIGGGGGAMYATTGAAARALASPCTVGTLGKFVPVDTVLGPSESVCETIGGPRRMTLRTRTPPPPRTMRRTTVVRALVTAPPA